MTFRIVWPQSTAGVDPFSGAPLVTIPLVVEDSWTGLFATRVSSDITTALEREHSGDWRVEVNPIPGGQHALAVTGPVHTITADDFTSTVERAFTSGVQRGAEVTRNLLDWLDAARERPTAVVNLNPGA